jgi:ProP effector
MTNPKNDLQDVVDWLVETFPGAFFKTKQEVRPLSLGIMDDLLDFYQRLTVPPFSKKQLRAALNFYTSSGAYLKSQKMGAMRLDLSGEEVDVVDFSQECYAKETLKARKERAQSK